jgi:glycosyltransferase involved in cell wall biosynthesis
VKENGILVHDGSDQELIDAMQLLLSESQKDRAHREAESSRIVRKYSSQEMANRYMEIYWNLLK